MEESGLQRDYGSASGDKGHDLPLRAAFKSATFINANNDCDRQHWPTNRARTPPPSAAGSGPSRLSQQQRVGFGMFLHKRSSQECKTKAEYSFRPRATGNLGGFCRTESTSDARVEPTGGHTRVWGGPKKAQKNKYATKDTEMKHCEVKEMGCCVVLRVCVHLSATGEWIQRTRLAQRDRAGHRRRPASSSCVTSAPTVEPTAQHTNSHDNYLNQVWHKEEKKKRLNLSGYWSSSPLAAPSGSAPFSRRSRVSPSATPPSGPPCFWSQTPAKK